MFALFALEANDRWFNAVCGPPLIFIVEPILYAVAAVLAITALINVAAHRFGLPSPVLLVVAGIALVIVPGLPRIALPPKCELI
ncbi:MAG: hypothetical protein M3P99_06230 [Pseudomonadota bacterium]|nr:hypothetical protein [Pseudomonadota bacterium]